MKTARFALPLALALMAIAVPRAARADSFTYTYQGPQFTQFGGTDSCTAGEGECSITVSATLAAPLGDSLTGLAGEVTPTAFTISDGSNTISQNSPSLIGYIFVFLTDSSGAINGWDIQVGTEDRLSGAEISLVTNNSNLTTRFGCSPQTLVFEEGSCQGNTSVGGVGVAAAPAGDFGTWTVETPEPSSMLLLGTGLLGLVFARRKLMPN